MEFQDLANLRRSLKEILGRQVESLRQYYDAKSGGFYHRHDKKTPGDPSKSSTATCVLSLVATRKWTSEPWKDDTDRLGRPWNKGAARLAKILLESDWTSAGLPEWNAFTVAFVLEAATELSRIDKSIEADAKNRKMIAKAERTLIKAITPGGGVSVQGYPPSAYITQLTVRVLVKRNKLSRELRERIRTWAVGETRHQLSLLLANNKIADVFQLAYAVIIVGALTAPDKATPDDTQILDAALSAFFERQRADGTWPLSRPLFHYPKVGSAHCFDYELLVQLLSEPRLQERVLRYVDKLRLAADGLKFTSYPLAPNAIGWSSGHHPQVEGPESWSTASVYQFAHTFERLLAEQIRRSTFNYLNVPYEPSLRRRKYSSPFKKDFLDCQIQLDGEKRSLKQVVSRRIVAPLIEEEKAQTIEGGGSLAESTPMSMIFFGPPGTSKTQLAKKIANAVGWPLLALDPSAFVKGGIDGVYAEADRAFGMLAVLERVVVLLDEFDEMVRERGSSVADSLSRFLTTAMLPKLIKINENRRIVVIVATNHLEAFDVAIRRPGRFDAILQVMPPTLAEKSRQWKVLTKWLTPAEQTEYLTPLTFAECKLLANRLQKVSNRDKATKLIRRDARECTLNSRATKTQTWLQVCAEQRDKSRVL